MLLENGIIRSDTKDRGEKMEPLYLLTYDHGGVILWGVEHFAERLRNAIEWLEKYPHFKIGLENEAFAYDALAENDLSLLDEIREYRRKYAGRFEIGSCTYGQPLSAFINEESNIRQIAYAVQTNLKHFGYTPSIYLMSEHAMHSQIPQIIKGFGFRGAILRTHFMMYGYNPTFDTPYGWWIGADGSRIPAVPTYPGEGAQFGVTTVDNWFLTRYPGPEGRESPKEFRAKFAHIQPLLASRADDSSLRREELVAQLEGDPEYRWILLDEIPAIMPEPETEMRTGPNDFTVRMPWGYCGNEIWITNRKAETQALIAERLAALETMMVGSNCEKELEMAWKHLLVAQHHDVQICGLLPEARKHLSISLEASGKALNMAIETIASRMKGDGLGQITVFNPLSWRRKRWIEVEICLKEGEAKAVEVTCGGDKVPSRTIGAERRSDGSISRCKLAVLCDTPSLGVLAYSIRSSGTEKNECETGLEIDEANLRIITPYYDMCLNPNGGIDSLTSRRSNKPLLASHERMGVFEGVIEGKACASCGRWTLQKLANDAPYVTAREMGEIGGISYTFEMTLHANDPRVDCHAEFEMNNEKVGRLSDNHRDGVSGFLHEEKLRFKLHPLTGEGTRGVRDLPFVIAETNETYVEGVYWAATAGSSGGLAYFNRGTMGAVREEDGGFSLPLIFAMYYVWGTRMLTGNFGFDFAYLPFEGDWRDADLHAGALEYNYPLIPHVGETGDGSIGECFQPIMLETKRITLSALYTENGKVHARFYECGGERGELKIHLANSSSSLMETNMRGESLKSVSSPLPFEPLQIRTFRIEGNEPA